MMSYLLLSLALVGAQVGAYHTLGYFFFPGKGKLDTYRRPLALPIYRQLTPSSFLSDRFKISSHPRHQHKITIPGLLVSMASYGPHWHIKRSLSPNMLSYLCELCARRCTGGGLSSDRSEECLI